VLRFFPAYWELHNTIRDKRFGRVLSATFVRQAGLPQWSKWLMDETRSGGAVLDLLVHDIDQALWLFGIPERVAAKSMGGADTLMASLIYPRGPEVRIQGGWFSPETPFEMSFQVRFERAEMEMNTRGVFVSDAHRERRQIALESKDPYYSQIEYFVDCCRRGVPPERCMPDESAQAVKVALLLKQSRSEGGAQLRCSV
jgi:predicted dehydrogenase